MLILPGEGLVVRRPGAESSDEGHTLPSEGEPLGIAGLIGTFAPYVRRFYRGASCSASSVKLAALMS